MNHSMSLCEIFYKISADNYNTFIESKKGLEKLVIGNGSFDVLADNAKESMDLYNRQYKTSITAIVFQALAVEAYINLFGTVRLGEKLFDDHYDRLSILDKIIIVTHRATGKDFPKGNNIYNKLKKLFMYRNRIAHNKPGMFSLDEINDDTVFWNKMDQSVNFAINNVDELIGVYPEFKSIITKLDGQELDLCQQELIEASKNIGIELEKMTSSLGRFIVSELSENECD